MYMAVYPVRSCGIVIEYVDLENILENINIAVCLSPTSPSWACAPRIGKIPTRSTAFSQFTLTFEV